MDKRNFPPTFRNFSFAEGDEKIRREDSLAAKKFLISNECRKGLWICDYDISVSVVCLGILCV